MFYFTAKAFYHLAAVFECFVEYFKFGSLMVHGDHFYGAMKRMLVIILSSVTLLINV